MKYYTIFIFIGICFTQFILGMEEEDIQSSASSVYSKSGVEESREEENESEGEKFEGKFLSSFCPFYFSLNINNDIKREASRKSNVWVDKALVTELIDKIINLKKKPGKIKTAISKLVKSPRSMADRLQERLLQTSSEMISLAPYDIATILMPSLLYYPHNPDERNGVADYFVAECSHLLLDTSNEIALRINGKPKIVRGQLAECINGLRGLHILHKMGICIPKYDIKLFPFEEDSEHSEQRFLLLINSNPLLIGHIRKILTMCHQDFNPPSSNQEELAAFNKD